ncbi:hypothetical protein CC2G_002349 [Coprinopsis cinerea AmutBmut pab1-1]|nr:hypothetical protein CC2G_002349 [Coprinopsis cinerea AmutBmut pab1-1]
MWNQILDAASETIWAKKEAEASGKQSYRNRRTGQLPIYPQHVTAKLRPSRQALLAYTHQCTVTIAKILFKYIPEFENISANPLFTYQERRKVPDGHKTIFYPLRASTIEEASIDGNLQVHDNIYRTQLRRDPHSLSKVAIPLYADQLTLARVRGAQDLRLDDVNAWERHFVFQLAPGVFHLVMNLLWCLLHVHRGTMQQLGSLSSFFALMEKTRLGNDQPDYHTLLMAMTQVLHGLILNAWRIETGRHDLNDFAKEDPTPEQILSIARDILQKHATPTAPPKPENPKAPPQPLVGEADVNPDHNDVTLYNVHLLTRDLLYVIELVTAIETGDWGRCEDILPSIACLFRGGGLNNYLNEILYLLYNLKHVWMPEFANIMRDNSLVNPSGLPGCWMGADMNIEHLIRYLKALFASKGLYSNWNRLGNISASVNYLMLIKKQVARSLRIGYHGSTHTTPDVSKLVWRVANHAHDRRLQVRVPN